jgi:hypothetical protein
MLDQYSLKTDPEGLINITGTVKTSLEKSGVMHFRIAGNTFMEKATQLRI